MVKYVSDIINPENLKIETSRYEEKDIRYNVVTLTLIDSGITDTVTSKVGQLDAYNTCIKNLEKKYLLSELDIYKTALEFVKSDKAVLQRRSEVLKKALLDIVTTVEDFEPDKNGLVCIGIDQDLLVKLKECLSKI